MVYSPVDHEPAIASRVFMFRRPACLSGRLLAAGILISGLAAILAAPAPIRADVHLVNERIILPREDGCGGSALASPAAGTASPAPVAAEAVVPGRLIVRFRSGGGPRIEALSRDADGCVLTASPELNSVAHALGVAAIEAPFHASRPSPLEEARILSYRAAIDPRDAAAIVSRLSSVIWAEPDHLRRVSYDPNDFYYPFEWHLWKVRAGNAWDFTLGDPNVVIAVIDTGLDRTHPDLAANVWRNAAEEGGSPGVDDDGNGYVDDLFGWDFVTVPPSDVIVGEDAGPADDDPSDFIGHGTMVAGVAVAVANNNIDPNINTVGGCPGCRVMGLRAGYYASTGGGTLQSSAIAGAILYAADNGARIVNMSFGGSVPSHLENEAIAEAQGLGLLFVAAAGNFACTPAGCSPPDQPSYPAAQPGVIAVAATDPNDVRATFSKYGSWVDLTAPGDDIITTFPQARYSRVDGTSFSAPLVAAAGGLILSREPALSAPEVAARLLAGAVPVDPANPGYEGLLGAGRLDMYRSILAGTLVVENVAGDPNTPAPPLTIASVIVDPNAPWLSFAASFPVTVDSGDRVLLDPVLDPGLAGCGANTAAVSVATDDPNRPAVTAEVSFTLDCDVDGDGHECPSRGGDDCDDADPRTSPEALEICDGQAACSGTAGEDENCDGDIDEVCSCAGPPNAPEVAGISTYAGGPITMRWRDLADNESGFRIFRRKGSGSWTLIARLAPDATSFDDTKARSGKRYTYSIRAYNRTGASARIVFPSITAP